jgi:hypothetical protein
MATAMTYTTLLVDIRRYLERGSVVDTEVYAQLPSIIGLAERAIARRLKVTGTMNVVESTLVAGTSVYAKPDRWRRTVSMEFGLGTAPLQTREPIYTRSYEYCREYWPNSDLQDVPKFYADYDYAHWLIVPTPVASYPWQIIYYELPPLLEDSNQTNWLTDYAPNALLYRCLLEAEPFLKNDARMNTWRQLYEEAVESINLEDLEKVVDRSSVRVGD